MPVSPEELLRRLEALGVATVTHRHAAAFTVEEAKRHRGDLPGGHCKCLFLKDKKGGLWLVVALEDRAIDLKALRGRLGAGTLSFGRPELLREALGVEPGSVTPFAAINDSARRVRVLLDREMMELALVNYHPLTNRATTALRPADLLTFLRAVHGEPEIVDLS